MAKVGSFKIVEQFFSKANINKLIVCLGRYDLGHWHVAQSPSPQRRVMQISADCGKPDKPRETAKILLVAQNGELKKVKRPRIDLFLEGNDGREYYFDLKTCL